MKGFISRLGSDGATCRPGRAMGSPNFLKIVYTSFNINIIIFSSHS